MENHYDYMPSIFDLSFFSFHDKNFTIRRRIWHLKYGTISTFIGLIIGLACLISSCGHKVEEPSIESVSPPRGQPGNPVVILGADLLDQYLQTKIIIAGTEVNSREIYAIEEDRIRFRIPNDVFSGELQVEVGDERTNAVPFEVIGSWLYVLHGGSTRVTAIETHAHHVEQTFELPFVPTNILFSYDGRYAYAIHKEQDMITVIRCFDNAIIATIPVESKPHTGANIANLDNPYVFILHEGSNNVTVINTERNEVAAVLPLACPPTSIAVSSDGEVACVVCRNEQMLYLINVEDLEISEATALEFRPGKIEMGPDNERLVILNDADNALTVVEMHDIENQDTITFESEPVDFAVSLLTGYACVIHRNNTASIVRLRGPELRETLEVGVEPVAVALEPFHRYAFVANRQSRNLSVIDLQERASIVSISLEASPLILTTMETAVGNWLYVANEQAPWLSVVSFGRYKVDEGEEPDPDLFSFMFSLQAEGNPIVMETQEIHRRPAAEEGFPESGIP